MSSTVEPTPADEKPAAVEAADEEDASVGTDDKRETGPDDEARIYH